MAGSQVTDFTNQVVSALGGVAPAAKLVALSNAANTLQGAANAPVSVAQWQAAVAGWVAARNDLKSELRSYLLQGLPNIPGLDALAAATGWDSAEGLHGELDLGPLHLALASASLTVQPPPVGAQALDAILVGPYQPLGITASIASPFGGDALPGGGSIFRLPDKPGFAGLLHIPLGAVSADASAVLERMPDGTPSFLAVLGITFTTPIQLSFGFSLDRVGGIVGVHRTFDAEALALAAPFFVPMTPIDSGVTVSAAGPVALAISGSRLAVVVVGADRVLRAAFRDAAPGSVWTTLDPIDPDVAVSPLGGASVVALGDQFGAVAVLPDGRPCWSRFVTNIGWLPLRVA